MSSSRSHVFSWASTTCSGSPSSSKITGVNFGITRPTKRSGLLLNTLSLSMLKRGLMCFKLAGRSSSATLP
ncbi:hypothetical protein PF007_g26693 [Phytophthora fragariae]|uniref:Uncharacterized protein n=1 Tax=Phytophthora fragariae TaxID=53985 RepID=A0A6A3Q841_9STRA|nr:hypothetical protein PF007_g26693 [Phytophthora fragariae]